MRQPPWGWSVGRALGLGARRLLLRAGLAAAAGLLLLWVSIFAYGAFYCAYVPHAAVTRTLHYSFRTDCASPGPELCSFPTANVSLLGPDHHSVLSPGQVYSVQLELEVPESGVNRDLGLFLVSASTYGPQGQPIAASLRTAMLHYRSRLLRTLHTLACSGLLLAGFLEQKQTLRIELFDHYREDPYVPTAGAVLELRSRRLQFYRCQLLVHARFSGLRYLLFHFPLTSALLGVAGNFSLLLLLLLGGALQRGRGFPWTRPRPAHLEGPREESRDPPGGAGEAPPEPGSEEPEELGPEEPREDSPPPEEEEEEKPEGGASELATPTPADDSASKDGSAPLLDGPALSAPGPAPRRRPVCSSS